MHKLNIIGVSGQAGSGKDTVADYLVQSHGFTKVALADPLKRFGHKVFAFTEEQLWGPSGARNAVDERYDTDEAWEAAQANMEYYGRAYVCDVVEDPTMRLAAIRALVHWFFWLRETYKGKLSPRVMLQALGTEWGREAVSDRIWMDYFLKTARTLLNEDGGTREMAYRPLQGCYDARKNNAMLRQQHKHVTGVVVSDVRFENEFQIIRSTGGAMIRVIRPDTDADSAMLGIVGHASEAHDYSFENFDFILRNEGTLDDLYRNVDTYMSVFDTTHH